MWFAAKENLQLDARKITTKGIISSISRIIVVGNIIPKAISNIISKTTKYFMKQSTSSTKDEKSRFGAHKRILAFHHERKSLFIRQKKQRNYFSIRNIFDNFFWEK